MKQIINSPRAPQAVGPYSQAVVAGNFIFISGQISLDPETMKIVGKTTPEQAEQVFKNIGAILEEAGIGFEDIVKATVLLKDIKDFAAVNEVYAMQFSGGYPARAAYQVAELPLGALVEIEAIAYREGKK
jgi:2-iminobutanoate/2-iminopropanoate deaminase